jgi:hypothetical protein
MIFIKTRAVVSWSYGNWIYNYICNQCRTPLTLWVRIPIRRCALDKTLCEKVCHWLPAVRWFYPGTPVSSTNKTDLHDIAEILLKVALNTITPTLIKTKHTIWYGHTSFSLGHCIFCPLPFMTSDYPFGIFNIFFISIFLMR